MLPDCSFYLNGQGLSPLSSYQLSITFKGNVYNLFEIWYSTDKSITTKNPWSLACFSCSSLPFLSLPSWWHIFPSSFAILWEMIWYYSQSYYLPFPMEVSNDWCFIVPYQLTSYLTATELGYGFRKGKEKNKGVQFMLENLFPSGTVFLFVLQRNDEYWSNWNLRPTGSCMYYKNSLGPKQGNTLYDFKSSDESQPK